MESPLTYLVGQQLGRYIIQEEIGRGGMAHVYRALDTLLQRTVALKVLAPQLAIDPEFARRFEREAVTAANLRHPNIVTIYDVGEHNGLRYIAMEYVRGRTLHAIIEERGALGLGYAIGIIGPVAAALDHAHSQEAVHRDVKPQNIMIDTDGRVLLTDFGIAQAPEGPSGERLTRTGIFMGTPEYISPEQASAQRVDGRSDLYSLGIATYEIITGVVPFSGATPQLIVAHVQSPPPPPSSIDPAQPPEVDAVLARILAKRPEQRFASGDAFLSALQIVARKHGIASATATQLAGLVLPKSSSAGQSTVSLGRGQTPRGQRGPIVPPPLPPPTPADADLLTQAGRPTLPKRPPPLRERPVTPPVSRPLPDAAPYVRTAPRPTSAPQPSAAGAGGAGSVRVPWTIAGPVLGGLFLALLLVLYRGASGRVPGALTATPNPTPIASLIPTLVTETPTLTPLPTAEPTLMPTEELTPTLEPTLTTIIEPTARQATRVPPVPTPEPPTPEPPTATPEPPTTIPEPPSATPEPPTATSPPSATPTATSIISPSPLPTATATISPTLEPKGPTNTPTASVSPEPTLTPEPTLPPLPTATLALTLTTVVLP
jgi:serine/threonine-protein kinase